MAKNDKIAKTSTVIAVAGNSKAIESMGKMGEKLSKLNTMRGGEKGFKGFVAEEMQAAEATAAGKSTIVINNNGPADLIFAGENGHKYLQQMKVGYKPGQIDFAKYKGQTVVFDKGNPSIKQFAKEGKMHGVKVVEGSITKQEAKSLADAMQFETKITGAKSATIIPKVVSAHNAGLKAGRTGALYGAGISIGTNLVDVVKGDKEVSDAAVDVAKDTVISYGAGYAAGAVGSAVAGTSAGAAGIAAVSSVGSAVAGTTVGGAVLGVAGAAAGAVGAVGTAATATVVGAAGTVGSVVGGAALAATAGTAIGGVVASGVAATAAAGAALGAAAVAAAPVVAVGVGIGILYKGIKCIFG